MISFESCGHPNSGRDYYQSHFAAGETETERLSQHYALMGG